MNRNACAPFVEAAPRRARRGLLAAAALLALAAVPAGCAAGGDLDTGVSAEQFQDMVVPLGFTLLDKTHQSHSRVEGEWRMGNFHYQGQLLIADAANYIRQRMPQHNWTIESEQLDDKGGKLLFARGRYTAEYTFQRQEGTTLMVVDYRTDFTRR
jgi:hypothetical protein